MQHLANIHDSIFGQVLDKTQNLSETIHKVLNKKQQNNSAYIKKFGEVIIWSKWPIPKNWGLLVEEQPEQGHTMPLYFALSNT